MYVKSISTGPGLVASNTATGGPYVTGVLRWNGSSQCMEVMDGQGWQQLYGSYQSVEMNPTLYQWAMEKMAEEAKLKELCKTNPGLQEAYERLEIMKTLVTQEEVKNEVV